MILSALGQLTEGITNAVSTSVKFGVPVHFEEKNGVEATYFSEDGERGKIKGHFIYTNYRNLISLLIRVSEVTKLKSCHMFTNNASVIYLEA